MNKQKAAKELGRLGGLKTKELYGPDHYRKMQKLGVATKLAKKQASTVCI